MSVTRSRGAKAFRSVGQAQAGSSVGPTAEAQPDGQRPDWKAVEQLLATLARTHAVFSTENSSSNWISAYEPGRRLMLEAGSRSSWIRIEHIRACWETFERRGRVCRRDVLEPGRHSAFMMGLFEQLHGVERDPADDGALVFARPHGRARS